MQNDDQCGEGKYKHTNLCQSRDDAFKDFMLKDFLLNELGDEELIRF